MDEDAVTGGDDQHAARVARARAYLTTLDPAEGRALLAAMEADVGPADTAARARLRTWAWGLATPAEDGSPDGERYGRLLPLVLAGTVAPGSAEYRWFADYLDRCDPCREEYLELQQLLDAESLALAELVASAETEVEPILPADSEESWVGPLPQATSHFVQEKTDPYEYDPSHSADVAEGIWASAFTLWLKSATEGEVAQLQVGFAAAPVAASPAEADPDAPQWKTLVSQVVPPDPALGLSDLLILSVQAQRQATAEACQVYIGLGGPGLRGRKAGIPLLLSYPGAVPLPAVTDAQGIAAFPVPIAQLPHLTITITLAPPAELMGDDEP